MTSDLALLQDYARNNVQASFTTLVNRHLDLVFSAALRQVRSPQLAEEVAQSVFTDLARSAAKLKPNTILTAWLYQVTRRTAIDVIRREARRQLREQIASEMNAIIGTAHFEKCADEPDWNEIEPLLDEAMEALDETDRTAVLLRYFESKPLREVGQQLGVSEGAAQKRVSRAVERLREYFGKRGVTVAASGLVVGISANAVQAAPAGLAATITAATTITGTAAATVAATTTKAIAMTTLQKTAIVATLAVVAGGGIYKAQEASHLRKEVQTLQQQQAPLAEHVEQLQQEREEAQRQIASLLQDNERLNRNTGELLRLRGEVTRLRRKLADAAQRLTQLDSTAASGEEKWVIGGIQWHPEWKDVGLGSPDTAVRTYWYARANADLRRLKQCTVFDRVTNCVPVSDIFAKREARVNSAFYGKSWSARLAAVTQNSPLRGRLQVEWMATPDGAFDAANPPEWRPDRVDTIDVMRNSPEEDWKVVRDENQVVLTIDDEDSEAVAKMMLDMDPETIEQLKSNPRLPARTLQLYEELKAKAVK